MARKTNIEVNGKNYYRVTRTIGHRADGTAIRKQFYGSGVNEANQKADEYINKLAEELKFVSGKLKGRRLRSVYIGGGTPTSLNDGQFEKLMENVSEIFDLQNVDEFTVEAGRPDTITKAKLEAMKKAGVNRISVNPQTMNQKTLDIIGRRHSVEDIKKAFYGFF